jgi:hypothetical protein
VQRSAPNDLGYAIRLGYTQDVAPDEDDPRSADDGAGSLESPGGPTDAALFDLLWVALADLLGTAAIAALLRRAAKHATSGNAELAGLVIQREGLGYRYTVPEVWRLRAGGPSPALRALVYHLRPILVELTGPVVLQRLERIPELGRWINPPEEKKP